MKEEGRDEHEIKKMGEVLQVDSLLSHNFLRIIKYVGFGRSQCFGSSIKPQCRSRAVSGFAISSLIPN
jgi:hypothetical protein